MAKSLLIISRQSPWSGPGAREALGAGTVYNYILTDRLGRQVLNTLSDGS
mgnify:CR=1 FL=1